MRSLEREVSDLYSEFQNDRADYLETIRRQDQQLKLLQGLLDKIAPTIRRDCNYRLVVGYIGVHKPMYETHTVLYCPIVIYSIWTLAILI